MAETTGVDWRHEYNKLRRTCDAAGRRAGRDLAIFGLGAAVSGGVAAGLWHWNKKRGCACPTTPAAGGEGKANGNGNGKPNGNGKSGGKPSGNGKGVLGKGKANNGKNGNNGGDPGGMVPGDS